MKISSETVIQKLRNLRSSQCAQGINNKIPDKKEADYERPSKIIFDR